MGFFERVVGKTEKSKKEEIEELLARREQILRFIRAEGSAPHDSSEMIGIDQKLKKLGVDVDAERIAKEMEEEGIIDKEAEIALEALNRNEAEKEEKRKKESAKLQDYYGVKK